MYRTTEEVKESRCHIKMLCGDYCTYFKKSNQSGGSPHCRVCGDRSTDEDILHILTQCSEYADIREKKLEDLNKLCQEASHVKLKEMSNSELCQFLLDPTSLNLKFRINPMDPHVNRYLEISRSLCNSINNRRLKILSSKEKKEKQQSRLPD